MVAAMAVSATLSNASLQVPPGGETSCAVTVRNGGTVVDELSIDLVGEVARWAEVTPPSVNLFPGAEAQVTVTFRPPKLPSTPAGAMPFGVKVSSREDPNATVVEEGALELGAFVDMGTELIPKTSRGRRVGRHELAFDNRGNTLVQASLSGGDADDQLEFRFSPAGISALPGTATIVRVQARPKKRFLTGAAKTHPFQLTVQPRDAEAMTVDGTMLQEPLIPKWVPAAAVAAIALILIGVVLWFTVLKPTVRSAAKDAVKQPLATQQAQLNNLAQKVPGGTAATGGGGAGAGAGGGGTGAGSGGSGGGSGGKVGSTALGDPTDGRLGVSVAPASSGNATVDPGAKVLSVTDIVLENAQGDTGTLSISRDSQVLLSIQLGNFRDLDYHFVSPMQFSKHKMVVTVTCTTPGGTPAAASCSDAVYYSGYAATTS
jgi:hypothetical protein